MGGLAGAAGGQRLIQPLWLEGGDAVLPVGSAGPVLWWLDLDEPATRRRAEAVGVWPGEVASFARRADAGERLLRRRLARLLLASIGGTTAEAVAIGADRAGAPVVTAPAGLYLSVAARWPAALIGVARQPIGVDLERAEAEPPALDLLTATERATLVRLPAADRALAFAGCWAAKEAHAKWSGRPRSLDPAAIQTGEGSKVSSAAGTTWNWQRQRGDLVAACVMAPD